MPRLRHNLHDTIETHARLARACLACVLVATAGCSDRTFDNPVDPKVPLKPVSSISLTILADTAITVAWEYDGPAGASFEIERQAGGGSFDAVGSGPPGVHMYVDRFPLVVGQTYTYRVRTLLSDNRSTYAESPAQQFLFVSPTSLQVSAVADTSVLVQWTYSGATQTGFEVERRTGGSGFTVVARVGPAVRQLLDPVGVTIGAEPTYRVCAVASVARSGYTSEQTVALSFPPPTTVALSAEGDTAVVTWTSPSGFQTGFQILRQVNGGAFVQIAAAGLAARQLRDTSLFVDGMSYVYRVRAVSKYNQSSAAESAPFRASLAAPGNVRIYALTPAGVRLQWQDSSTIETGFEIEESGDGTTFSLLAVVPRDSVRVTIAKTYAPAAHPYYFRVRAHSSRAPGAYSRAASKPGFVLDMVFVEGGTFQMGSTGGTADEQPVHAITLSPFYIDPREVTVFQYNAFCTATSRTLPAAPAWGWNNLDPMVLVSHDDASAYARWAGKRLPTEAEWEYAARGGQNSKGYTFSGSNDLNSVGWYFSNSSSTPHQTGTKTPNELGISDMSGNVYEWCADWYDGSYYNTSPSVNPPGPASGTYRVVRGGSFDTGGAYCRSTFRAMNGPAGAYVNTGFRCVVDQ